MDNWYASYVVPITKHILLHYVYTASTWLHLSTIQSIFISFITFSSYYFFTSFSFFFLTTFYVQDKLTSVKTKQKENLMLVNPRLFSFSFHTSM